MAQVEAAQGSRSNSTKRMHFSRTMKSLLCFIFCVTSVIANDNILNELAAKERLKNLLRDPESEVSRCLFKLNNLVVPHESQVVDQCTDTDSDTCCHGTFFDKARPCLKLMHAVVSPSPISVPEYWISAHLLEETAKYYNWVGALLSGVRLRCRIEAKLYRLLPPMIINIKTDALMGCSSNRSLIIRPRGKTSRRLPEHEDFAECLLPAQAGKQRSESSERSYVPDGGVWIQVHLDTSMTSSSSAVDKP